ncbi:MAG TPA: SDR family oxidoreductase [Rhizomicrobium sp.]|nr:SDR family oxidoreductase [Rhizomicrobium sp.]
MRIAIIGGSRGVGLAVANEAVARGHEVVIVSRSDPRLIQDKVHWLGGDARDSTVLERAVKGCDATVTALGVTKTWSNTNLFSQSAVTLVRTMQDAGIKRAVLVTGLGAGDSRGHQGWLYDNVLFPVFLARSYADKDRAEAIFQKSNLDWTIVRPGRLTNGPKKDTVEALLTPETYRYGSISRADVAAFVLNCVEKGNFLRQTPQIVDRA